MPQQKDERGLKKSKFSDGSSLYDAHHGKTAFVIGNGRSVLFYDTDKMAENGIMIGCNLGFRKHKLDYLCWQDTKIADACASFDGIKVTNFKHIKRSAVNPKNWFCFNYSKGPPDGFLKMHTGGLALQLAIIMGCNPIFLVGCDGAVVDACGVNSSNVFMEKGRTKQDYIKVNGKYTTIHLQGHAKGFNRICNKYKENANVFQVGDWGIVDVPHVDFPEFYGREHPKKGNN